MRKGGGGGAHGVVWCVRGQGGGGSRVAGSRNHGAPRRIEMNSPPRSKATQSNGSEKRKAHTHAHGRLRPDHVRDMETTYKRWKKNTEGVRETGREKWEGEGMGWHARLRGEATTKTGNSNNGRDAPPSHPTPPTHEKGRHAHGRRLRSGVGDEKRREARGEDKVCGVCVAWQ